MNDTDLPSAGCVLLLVDFINPLDFPGAEDLASEALLAAHSTAALKQRLRKCGIPTIYANDNFGSWQSNFRDIVKKVSEGGGESAQIARALTPLNGDLTVLKPRHSAFLGSPLDYLLNRIGAKHIIVTGLAADICVQLTVADAFLQGYSTHVPEDCTAAESATAKKQALKYMQRVLKSEISSSSFIDGPSLLSEGR
jgi:nicotinamidase-related amidase